MRGYMSERALLKGDKLIKNKRAASKSYLLNPQRKGKRTLQRSL